MKGIISVVRYLGKPRVQLFLTSFLLLFLELSLIRFVPAYIRYLGYFTNFILLGSFLGIGVGCLLAKNKRDFSFFFPFLLLALFLIIKFFKFEVSLSSSQVIFFASNSEDNLVQSYFLLPGVFLIISLIFATVAQKLGKLFGELAPLSAYSVDIIGSIAGTVAFTFCSFLSFPPLVWFGIVTFLYLLVFARKVWFFIISGAILIGTTLLTTQLDSLPTIWSPYYKIGIYSVTNPDNLPSLPYDDWRIYVNNIAHQEMTTFEKVPEFYKLVYDVFPKSSYKRALIIGAGSGQDVNVALKYGVESIDAVEIDPEIANLGRRLHPESPYSNPKVNLIVNDGRAFLENTDQKYDLIVYALPDSAILSSNLSSIRLESYLFTIDAFGQARRHLTTNGVFVLYNYYRTTWLIDKIADMLSRTFGYPPITRHYNDNLAVFMTGPKTQQENMTMNIGRWEPKLNLTPASDNWPFLYLMNMAIPNIYLKSLLIIMALGAGLTLIATKGQIFRNIRLDFFFLGAAFLLIETKSVVNFNLLFGSTWLVNSLVFVAILTSVLAAIWVNSKYSIKKITPWVVALLVSLLLNYLVPINKFLVSNVLIRYLLATAFFFSPIFVANIIFSNLFKRAGVSSDNFGSNLLGAFVGGICEYLSLMLGYQNLVLVGLGFYLLAFAFIIKKLKRAIF